MARKDREKQERDRQVQARLDLLRAQQGGGMLGIAQNAPASEAERAKQAVDDWRPPMPAPLSGFATALAIAVLALIVVLFILVS